MAKTATYAEVRLSLMAYSAVMAAKVHEMITYGEKLEALAEKRSSAMIPIWAAFIFAFISAGVIGFIVNVFVHVTSFMFGIFMIPGFIFYAIGVYGARTEVLDEYRDYAKDCYDLVTDAYTRYQEQQDKIKERGLVPYVIPANMLDPAWIDLFIDYMDSHPTASMIDAHTFLQGQFDTLAAGSLNRESLISMKAEVERAMQLQALVTSTYPSEWLSAEDWFKKGGSILNY